MRQFRLLRQRRFGPFFLTQFLGAFNDNVFKNALIILIAFYRASQTGLSPDVLINLCAGLFILPFFLFSATAGQIADKYEKSLLIRRIKAAEIAIMSLAFAGFVLGANEFLIVVLFLMGAQSAFFGPIKYSIIPQHVSEEELVGANGLVEMGTFVAILLGTLCGGVLIAIPDHGPLWVASVLVLVAVGGWLASRGIPSARALDPGLEVRWNVGVETWRILQALRGNRTVLLSVLGISWFWFYGATILAQLPRFTKDTLGGDAHVLTVLLAVFSLGVGSGSLLCERLSGRRVEIGLVPFGAIGLTLFGADLALAAHPVPGAALLDPLAFMGRPGSLRVIADIGFLSVFGGFFIVPLYALVQQRSDPAQRARVIAANNVLNALFMVISAILAIVLLGAGLTIPQLFAVVALMTAAVAWFIFRQVPEFLLRFIVWLLVHTVYRLDLENIDAVPDTGAALLVSNHVSFVDALIITAASRRPIRFVMDHRIFAIPVLSFVFRVSRAIPIAPAREDPELLRRAYDEVAAALAAGELVGLFPEGRITDSGELNTFRGGVERIVERTPVPVVPLALRGLWGSFFSRKGGPGMSKPWRLVTRLRSRISLVAGAAVVPADVRAGALHDAVLALRGGRR